MMHLNDKEYFIFDSYIMIRNKQKYLTHWSIRDVDLILQVRFFKLM